jgi:hypothetical protein
MQPGMINNHTRVVGKSQGYIGLPLRDELTADGIPVMLSCWFPSPAELQDIIDGAPILLMVMGTQHPPVIVGTGEVPT